MFSTGSSPPNVIFKMSVLGYIYLFLEFALCPTLQSSLNILIFCVETSKFYCRATTASPTGSPEKMHHQENQNQRFLNFFLYIVANCRLFRVSKFHWNKVLKPVHDAYLNYTLFSAYCDLAFIFFYDDWPTTIITMILIG